MENPLGILGSFKGADGRKRQRIRATRIVGRAPDCVLVDQKPRLRHSYRNDGHVRGYGSGLTGGANLFGASFSPFGLCIAVYEEEITGVLRERQTDPGDKTARRSREIPEVGHLPRDAYRQLKAGENPVNDGKKRAVTRTIGNKCVPECIQEEAVGANSSNSCCCRSGNRPRR